MIIYRMENRARGKAERQKNRTKLSTLKIAAGGEDMISISNEAVECYKKNNIIKLQEHELKKLALSHIDDHRLWLDELNKEPEFVQAEKLVRVAELAIRTAPSANHDNIYDRVVDFVIDQLIKRS